MGTMGPLMVACSPGDYHLDTPQGGGPEVLLQGYRACLHQALRHIVEYEGAPTSDPRVLALTAHLTRRQAALELDEELRRRRPGGGEASGQASGQEELRRQLLADYFLGVDLHCSTTSR